MSDTFRKFWKSTDAAVSIETVLVMPVLMFFFVSSFVFFEAFRKYNQTVKAAYTVGDALSRKMNSVTQAEMEGLGDLFNYLTFNSEDTAWLRVTEVQRKASGYEVRWSYATDGKPLRTNATLSELMPRIPELSTDERIVVLETYSIHQPVIDIGIQPQMFQNIIVTKQRFASFLSYPEGTPANTVGDTTEGDSNNS